MVAALAKTPKYILKDGSQPASPILLDATSKGEIKVIFGFSDKPEYDQFQASSPSALTPYPLVKGYLVNQIAAANDTLKLIVLDASSPEQQTLRAASFEAVLEAFQSKADSVIVSHELVRDDSATTYCVQVLTNETTETLPT